MMEKEQPFYFGEHYLYKGFWYYCKFPVEWAQTHLPHTGPNECDNCAYHGSVHEGTIFVGYCLNCADRVYHFTRGPGMPTEAASSLDYMGETQLEDIPRLLCEEAEEDDDGNKSNSSSHGVSILECHYEGGYNDF
jgi:hypothetical protein